MNNFCNLLTKALKIWGKIATANMCISILLLDILFMGILEEVPPFPLLVWLPPPKEKKRKEPCKLHVQPFQNKEKGSHVNCMFNYSIGCMQILFLKLFSTNFGLNY
jgi:hypothetical protein